MSFLNKSKRRGLAAAVLVELIVASAIVVAVTAIILTLLNTGIVLFSKNTAMNIAHQQARIAVLQMEQDLHSAVSIPQLVDQNRQPIAGNGPAAGMSFQLFADGPFQVSSPAAAGQNQVTVKVAGFTPVAGQRLCVPTHQIELDITSVGAGSTDRILTVAKPLPRPIETTLEGIAVNTVCFITDRVSYVVINGELRYYGRGGAMTMMANDITTSTPFTIPVSPLGSQYNRFVAAINLSTADPSVTNRGYKSANMFLNALVPYRSRLCIYQ
jgi:hypothetical protein